jgi:hypothetical protein
MLIVKKGHGHLLLEGYCEYVHLQMLFHEYHNIMVNAKTICLDLRSVNERDIQNELMYDCAYGLWALCMA